ncbi:MAG: hypothetical protein ACYCQI_16845, partial [Gammaproteobacteria bacterium]
MPEISKKLYIREPTVLLKPVASPMGILKNPFDIALKSKPFWAIAESANPELQKSKKKTLIFAHHCYNKLSETERDLLMENLRKAKTEGFQILIQYPDGLKPWDGIDLPADYALDLKKFNKKAIE